MKNESELNITDLLAQLKEGSEYAFNALYKLHSKMLLSNINRLVKDNEVSKELLQELYLKIWEVKTSIDINKSFKSFLFTIAKNLVYDYFRKTALDVKARNNLIDNAIAFYSHSEEILIHKESSELLKMATNTLSPQCQKVYKLSKFEEKSHQEISELLEISISTVNNHMVKANKEIRAYLVKHADLSLILITSLMLSNIKY